MWYDIIKQDNEFFLGIETYGPEVSMAITNYSMGLTDTLGLRLIINTPTAKRFRKKNRKKLIDGIFTKIYSDIIKNHMELREPLAKDKFYELVADEAKKYTIIEELLVKGKITKKVQNLYTLTTSGTTGRKYQHFYKYARKVTPRPVQDLVSRGYIESISASTLAPSRGPRGTRTAYTHSPEVIYGPKGGKIRTLTRDFENSFIKKREIPPDLYLDKLRPYMTRQSTVSPNRSQPPKPLRRRR
jgi:hypothetical protein|tara:strand:+ start:4743 stop:5471 length:729 start_codon:yes stop_codon:yes gene_type:complete